MKTVGKTSLALLGLLASLTIPAFADDATTAVPSGAGGAAGSRCQANPDKCAEFKQKMQEKCAANPERCERMKQRRQEMKAKCAADPKGCEEKKAQMRERRQARRAAKGSGAEQPQAQ